ncbi:MAG: triosephosphate isomerase [Cycloclasticus sp.]|jgi:triosephosphate isomerase
MRKPLVVGNWKMNGSLKLTGALLRAIEGGINDKISSEVGVCVPFVYIALAIDTVDATRLTIGAQTVSEFESGAYTGEISASMLAELACRWVLVGHSERRMLFNESNQALVAKVLAAQRAGLMPIYCVGESEADYQSGKTLNVINEQVGALLNNKAVNLNQLVLAYEPVWAIGTGLTASPEEAQQAHVFIRGLVREKAGDLADKVRILYGGSVNPGNASPLFEQEDIDGGLIGGASLDADAFISICQKA